PYDLIFCRNVFIYFEPPARKQAMDTLLRLLAPDGMLCLGHADAPGAEERRLERTGPEGCFLYRRAAAVPPALPPVKAPSRFLPPPADSAPQTARELLDRARREADDGRLDEALERCRK